MAEKSISFRANLQSGAMDLLLKAKVHAGNLPPVIARLVSALAAYTEEGQSLSPEIFICPDAKKMMARIGIGRSIALGKAEDVNEASKSVLKVCAPLAIGNWSIFLEDGSKNAECSYGVFCGATDPTALSLQETLLTEFEPNFPIIRISQIARNKVSIRTSEGSGIEFRFNSDEDIPLLGGADHVMKLAETSISGLKHSDKELEFLTRVLTKTISECHGTIIAVIPWRKINPPDYLTDSVMLPEPLDLIDFHRKHFEQDQSAASLSRLQSAIELFSGMLNSDGITILDAKARIRGYRAFVEAKGTTNPTEGGARTRAFAALREYTENGSLVSALFRSQDGRTDFIQAEL